MTDVESASRYDTFRISFPDAADDTDPDEEETGEIEADDIAVALLLRVVAADSVAEL
jgi:hypothetical protein